MLEPALLGPARGRRLQAADRGRGFARARRAGRDRRDHRGLVRPPSPPRARRREDLRPARQGGARPPVRRRHARLALDPRRRAALPVDRPRPAEPGRAPRSAGPALRRRARDGARGALRRRGRRLALQAGRDHHPRRDRRVAGRAPARGAAPARERRFPAPERRPASPLRAAGRSRRASSARRSRSAATSSGAPWPSSRAGTAGSTPRSTTWTSRSGRRGSTIRSRCGADAARSGCGSGSPTGRSPSSPPASRSTTSPGASRPSCRCSRCGRCAGQFGVKKTTRFELIDLDGVPDVVYEAFARQLALVLKDGVAVAPADFTAQWRARAGQQAARARRTRRALDRARAARAHR